MLRQQHQTCTTPMKTTGTQAQGHSTAIWPHGLLDGKSRKHLCAVNPFPFGNFPGFNEFGTTLRACSMTTIFLDNKMCTFNILLWWRFPGKLGNSPLHPHAQPNIFGQFSPPPPCPTPLTSEFSIFIVVSPFLRLCATLHDYARLCTTLHDFPTTFPEFLTPHVQSPHSWRNWPLLESTTPFACPERRKLTNYLVRRRLAN